MSNTGASVVTGAFVHDAFPTGAGGLGGGSINWTCTPAGGATCGGGGTGNGTINRTVNMPVGSTITFRTTSGNVSSTTRLTQLTNTATVTVPAGYSDLDPSNNSAPDTDTITQINHVGDLDWTSVNTGGVSGTNWRASVTITVHNASHSPVAGVTVTSSWTGGGTGGGSCTTNASGLCTVSRNGLSRATISSVTYSVANLATAPPDSGYQIALNHDPDSGAQASSGSTITVPRP